MEITKDYRDRKGKYAKRRKWPIYFAIGCFLVIAGGMLTDDYAFIADWFSPELVYVANRAEAAEIQDKTLEQMENDLIDIVWYEESGRHVPEEGNVLLTFDPNSKMYQECIKIGGRHPKDCISYGPMQIKIGTIQHYAPKVYGHEVTEKEARDIAEDLEGAKHFFLTCTIQIEGCVYNWTGAQKHRTEVELLVKYIRAAHQ